MPEGERESIKAKEKKGGGLPQFDLVYELKIEAESFFIHLLLLAWHKGINEKQKTLFDLSIFQNSFSIVYTVIFYGK